MPPYGLSRDSSPALELVKTALDKLRDSSLVDNARQGKAEATDATIFTQDTASNAAVVSSVQGGGGYMEKRIGDFKNAKQVAVNAPTPKTTLIAEFVKDLDIPRTFFADQQHSSVAKAVRANTQSWLASRDRNAMQVYALGFTTQTTIDAVALFSNSHVNSNGDTVDNLSAGALTDGTANDIVVLLRNQVNQDGVKVGYEPDFMLTSNANHKNAMTVTKSVLRSGTGNNDLNYYSEMFPGMTVKYNAFLDETSTTAYFVGASGHGVTRFVRESFFTDLVDWRSQRNDAYIYKLRAREEVDSIEYSGLAGALGT